MPKWLGMRFLVFFLMSSSLIAQPPASKRIDHVDEFHGAKIPDPYRWLEQDTAETTAWVEAQSQYTQKQLQPLEGREAIRKRLTELFQFTRSAPYVTGEGSFAGIVKRGNRYFFLRQDGLQNQPILYVQEKDKPARELINPNGLSGEGIAALSMWAASPDGKLLAYGVAKAGSDWQEWRVRDVETGKDTADHLDWIKFSTAAWSPDSKGFFYGRYPTPDKASMMTAANLDNTLHYHRLGDNQAQDRLVYQRPDQREWRFSAEPTSDGNHLVITIHQGTNVEKYLLVLDLRNPDAKPRPLTPAFEAAYQVFSSVGNTLYLTTNDKAPRYRVISIDLTKPDKSNWKELIPQSQDTLDQVVHTNGQFVVQYLKDAHSSIRLHALDGKFLREVTLPGVGTASWSAGEPLEKEQFYSYASFTQPETIYRYDPASDKSAPFFTGQLPFDPSTLTTSQVFYPSKDGTRIPMFLIHRKGLKLTGDNPVLLYGYGGFNISLQPGYSILYLAWAEMGGVVAVANLRGGGEYGEDWHRAGMFDKKQNVFDDFISAAEWLIANKYTSRKKLAIYGGSNGGLLVGACLNQRPDLFAAAIPAVGVMDMLRFHKFTIGQAWTSEYGSPDAPEHFRNIIRYSPLHNIKAGVQYPPTLIMTADHDDRVVPLHSFKYAAALQHAQEGKAPILIRIDIKAGHGGGKPTAKRIDDFTDMLAFLKHFLAVK